MYSYRNSLLKTGRPTPKLIYNIHNPTSLKMLITLRFRLSHLNEHKFNHNVRDSVNPLYPCSLEVQSCSNFFLQCHYHTYIRKILFHELQSVDGSILNRSDTEILELPIYGSKKIQFPTELQFIRIYYQIHFKIGKT